MVVQISVLYYHSWYFLSFPGTRKSVTLISAVVVSVVVQAISLRLSGKEAQSLVLVKQPMVAVPM